METYYIKKDSGRYELAGYVRDTPLAPGLWLITGDKGDSAGQSRGYKNIFHRLNDVPDPTDVALMLQCVSLEDIISSAILKVRTSTPATTSAADMARDVCNSIYAEVKKDDECVPKPTPGLKGDL